MLRALGSPAVFLGLLVGFLLAVTVQAYVAASAARIFGDRPAFRRVFGDRPSLRRMGDLRRVLDPFGAVAAALGGLGWGVTPDIPLRSRGRLAVALLAGPVAVAVLGALALGGFVLVGGSASALPGVGPGSVLGDVEGPAGPLFFLGLGLELLGMAVLSLVPLPPLPGGSALFAVAPRTLGWQKAHHQLVERNIGTAVLLALLLIPLGGPQALLPTVLDSVLDPLVRAVSGG